MKPTKTDIKRWRKERNRKKKEAVTDFVDHVERLCDLEWNGFITLPHFRDRVQAVLHKLTKITKENR